MQDPIWAANSSAFTWNIQNLLSISFFMLENPIFKSFQVIFHEYSNVSVELQFVYMLRSNKTQLFLYKLLLQAKQIVHRL